jgi:hypothetical protein
VGLGTGITTSSGMELPIIPMGGSDTICIGKPTDGSIVGARVLLVPRGLSSLAPTLLTVIEVQIVTMILVHKSVVIDHVFWVFWG